MMAGLRAALGAGRWRGRWWYANRFGTPYRPQRWLFLVGSYNSGTTLLHRLLAHHPQIASLPIEGQFCTDQLETPRSRGLPRVFISDLERFRWTEESTPTVDLDRLLRQWGVMWNDPSRPIFVEKTPTNMVRTRWLAAHFANAHFVGLVRNGYAVAEGIFRKEGHSLVLASRQWAQSNRIMLADFGQLDHEMIVRYEDLAEHPETVVASVLDFVGADGKGYTLPDGALRIHEQKSAIQNMNARSLDALGPEQRALVRRVAGEVLDQLGYDETA